MLNTKFKNNSSTTVGKDSFTPPAATRYCLFVIPSRLALFVFSILLLISGAGFTAVGWVIADKLDKQLLEIERLALFFHIMIYFLVAVFALVGIYGAIQKGRKSTSMFSSLMLGQFVFNVASGALCLYLLFRDAPSGDGGQASDERWCMEAVASHPGDVFLRSLCERTPVMKGLSLAFYVFVWLTEIIAVAVSNQYCSQLREEAARMELLDPPDRESFYY